VDLSVHEGIFLTGLSTGALTETSFTTLLAAISAAAPSAAPGQDALVVAQDGTDTAFYVYSESTSTGAQQAELTMLALASGSLVAQTDVTVVS
jgi:hypothetical protein